MDFYAVLDQVLAVLRQRGRVSYRALKRQFVLDDAYLDDLKVEIIEVYQCAVDQQGTMLVWTGDAVSDATSAPVQAQAPLTYTPPHLVEKILTSRTALEGERKQVTVLFADLKGSMELVADRDPEEASQLLDSVLERMMAAVHRYEGTVNQIMGDGIMALFGAPLAHEDHAVRACYAALAMQAALHRYSDEVRRTQGLAVHFRIGLNAGEVVVRAISNDLHMDYSAIGQTVHLAARMEQLATPGSILLTAATLRLVEGSVRVHALGPIPVKGLADPVEVYELVGASALRGRFQARTAGGLTRFVGRDTELVALGKALERVRVGHGQVVAVVGEAGVGKSRLVYECIQAYHAQGWRVLESASVSYGKATPYFPVIDLLRRYAHIEEHDDPPTIRAKLTGQVLTLDEALQDTLPALLSLLAALPEDSPFLQLDPPQRRLRTLVALKRVLLRESQGQPVLLVCEDLHWIDTESQALLNSLVESLPTARLLLLVNYRPEYQHGWSTKTYYTQVRLDPLPPVSAEELLQAVLGDDPGLAPLKQLLIARTEGNPFFLEESVRALMETGVLVGEWGAYRLEKALPGLQVPATVQAVLAARIDRLPHEEKHLLQTAAVIGPEVPLPLLQVIAELSEETLHRGLVHLQAAEFLYETRLFPEQEYTFKHALTHEVAYGSLLQERRRALHARIVETLEAFGPHRVAEQAERLAHHARRGEVWDKAHSYNRQAGARAMTHSAYQEAVGYFEQALVALQHLPEQPSTVEQAIDLRFDLRNALSPLDEEQKILGYLQEAGTLAETLGDSRRLGQAAAYVTNYYLAMGDYDCAVESGRRALAIAAASKDFTLQVLANVYLGQVYYTLGDYRQAIHFFRQNVDSLTGDLVRERFGLHGLPAVFARSWLSSCLAEVGEFAEGMARGEEGVRIAETVDHPYSLIVACIGVGDLCLRRGDLYKAIPTLERGLALSQAGNLPVVFRLIATSLGYAYALSGRIVEALPLLERAVEQAASLRLMERHSLQVAWLSEAYLLARRMDEAIPLAQHALELARAHKERGYQAWVLRLLGDIAAYQEPPDVKPTEAHYRQALAMAKESGMRPLQAHCHRGLGTLYAATGQQEQARTELFTAITLYRAMEMTFWLPQAEAALAQMEYRPERRIHAR